MALVASFPIYINIFLGVRVYFSVLKNDIALLLLKNDIMRLWGKASVLSPEGFNLRYIYFYIPQHIKVAPIS